MLLTGGCTSKEDKSSEPTDKVNAESINNHTEENTPSSGDDAQLNQNDQQKKENIKPLSYDEKIKRLYDAYSIADSLLLKASQMSSLGYFKENYINMRKALSEATLRYPDEYSDFEKCTFGAQAFTPRNTKSIGICQLLLASEVQLIAQTLIHESAHLVGHFDECEATELELAAIKESSFKVPYDNDYVEPCGLSGYLK